MVKNIEGVQMKCPFCSADPLEVVGIVSKSIEGSFNEEGTLTTETHNEEVISLECTNCGKGLSLDLIKNWK